MQNRLDKDIIDIGTLHYKFSSLCQTEKYAQCSNTNMHNEEEKYARFSRKYTLCSRKYGQYIIEF